MLAFSPKTWYNNRYDTQCRNAAHRFFFYAGAQPCGEPLNRQLWEDKFLSLALNRALCYNKSSERKNRSISAFSGNARRITIMQKPDQFHSILAQRRKALGLTQEQLAGRLNVSPQAVSKWEKTSYPDAELLPKLAAALNLSLDALFGLQPKGSDEEPEENVRQALRSLPPEKRPELIAKVFYAALCAYDPSSDGATARLRNSYEHETFAMLHTDLEFALERLNTDFRYFFYMEKPEKGIADYLRDEKGTVRLLSTLADEEALRIVKYMACSCRNTLFVPEKLAEKLGIAVENVQKIINRLDRFGFVWRMSADLGGDAPTIVYGYTHNPALAALLVLAESLCRYIGYCDPKVDLFTYGTMQDRTSGNPERIPEVSAWDTDSI